MNYDNFFFPADDLAATKRFYQETLGLPVKFDFFRQGYAGISSGQRRSRHYFER
ncbi:VOC family protein [Kingella oralis]|uniref:VOC family protein n=1 Tax=Kingella oralis TaxID=505 RepID=UPI0034E60C57